MIDPDYSSKPGSYKVMLGIQSAALLTKSSSSWDLDETSDLCRDQLIFNGRTSGWCASKRDMNQYFQVGSSIPFIYEGFKMSGRMNGLIGFLHTK